MAKLGRERRGSTPSYLGIAWWRLGGDVASPFAGYLGALTLLAFSILLCMVSDVSAEDEPALWKALASSGHVALLRHATAPGTGDPPDFALGDCSTQRNLSTEGRAQAVRIGARFRENGIKTAHVLSSQWCRCLETAALLDLGPVEELPVLNSFYQRTDRRTPQTEALKDWLTDWVIDGPLVLVTHQVNISALTGVYPASGELVVVRISEEEGFVAIGSISTD
jgi:phosphohistidine phosphatase SixA